MRWLITMCFVVAACGGDDGFEFTAVTFNTGTSIGLGHDSVPPDDGYTEADAEVTDEFYGNGLSWNPFIEATAAYLAVLQPDVIAFQEIFHPGECAMIPAENHAGYICETWRDGDATVAQMVVGAGYQVACNLEKPDKCLAVKREFATIRGCAGDLCLDGLEGARVEDCGQGSRIGRGTLDLVGGGVLTVVAVHGSSGLERSDQDCRQKQFEQVFVDLDGERAANGTTNLVLGDFNTDPVRFSGSDVSADGLASFAGDGLEFDFVSDVGMDAEPTYLGIFNIDHIISDELDGDCVAAGVAGEPAVMEALFFDHVPIICDMRGPRPE